jgi:regulator of protease activity HflC (stomatin/prohibitin superfamily)
MGSEEEFINKVIRPASRAAFRKAARKYTMIELMGEMRDVLEDDIQKYVKTYVDEIARNSLGFKGGEPFIIQEVMVRNIEPPASFKAAVEAKLIADQEAQKMRFVLQKEQQEAERKKIEAQGIATFQRIVRQGIDEQLLRWKGIEATQELAESQNTKIVVIGGKNGLPLILNEGEAVKK